MSPHPRTFAIGRKTISGIVWGGAMVVSVSLKLGPNAPLCPHSPHTHPSYRNELRASRRACRRRLWGYIGRAWRLPANMGNSCMTVLQFLCTWVQTWCENLSKKGEQIMPNLGPEQGAENGKENGPITTRPPGLSTPFFWSLHTMPDWPLYSLPAGLSRPCPNGLSSPSPTGLFAPGRRLQRGRKRGPFLRRISSSMSSAL